MFNHVSECLLCDTKEGESQIFLERPIRHGTADEFYVDVRLRGELSAQFVQRRDQPEVNDRRRVQIVRQLTNVRRDPLDLIAHGTEPLLHAIVCGGKKPQDFAERKTSKYSFLVRALTDIVMQVIGQSLAFGLLAKQQTLANTLSRPGLFLVLRNVHTRADVATIGPGRLALISVPSA